MQVKLSGALLAGPPDGVSTGGVGSGSFSVPLLFFPGGDSGLQFQVGTGILQRNVAVSSPSFAVLSGIGTDDTVTKGTFLYAKTSAPLVLRITTDDGAGGSVTSLIPVNGGPVILPFDSSRFLKLLEVQGSGQIEYFVCGNQ